MPHSEQVAVYERTVRVLGKHVAVWHQGRLAPCTVSRASLPHTCYCSPRSPALHIHPPFPFLPIRFSPSMSIFKRYTDAWPFAATVCSQEESLGSTEGGPMH